VERAVRGLCTPLGDSHACYEEQTRMVISRPRLPTTGCGHGKHLRPLGWEYATHAHLDSPRSTSSTHPTTTRHLRLCAGSSPIMASGGEFVDESWASQWRSAVCTVIDHKGLSTMLRRRGRRVPVVRYDYRLGLHLGTIHDWRSEQPTVRRDGRIVFQRVTDCQAQFIVIGLRW
jgi:hypothetical protein